MKIDLEAEAGEEAEAETAAEVVCAFSIRVLIRISITWSRLVGIDVW